MSHYSVVSLCSAFPVCTVLCRYSPEHPLPMISSGHVLKTLSTLSALSLTNIFFNLCPIKISSVINLSHFSTSIYFHSLAWILMVSPYNNAVLLFQKSSLLPCSTTYQFPAPGHLWLDSVHIAWNCIPLLCLPDFYCSLQ